MNSDPNQPAARPVQRSLLIPLSGVLLLLLSGFSAALLFSQQRNLRHFSQHIVKDVGRSLDISLIRKARTLMAIEDILLQNTDLHEALQTQNRERLLAIYGPISRQLRQKYAIAHFYFHRPDFMNLLRLHKPRIYGDPINRFTLREAARTGNVAWGLELGKFGTLTLRVVQPIHVNNTVIGYLELGQEIETMLELIHRRLKVELAVTIYKNALERQKWETGMEMLGRKPHWERYKEEVLTYSTLSPFPDECDSFVHDTDKHRDGELVSEVQFGNRSWQLFSLPLKDASGTEVGDLYLLKDITGIKAAFVRLAAVTFSLALALLGGLVTFYYVVFQRTDRTIHKQQERLAESEEKYRSMMEALDDATYICSSDFCIEYMNPAMIKRIGRDATGETCHKAMHGLAEKCQWCSHGKVMRGEYTNNEVTSPLDNRSYHIANSPVFHTDGSVSKLAVFRDVTNIKQMEAHLRQAQKMEAIGTLAGGIAHDFNNILFPLMGFSEMLKEDLPDDSPLQYHVDGILSAAVRSKELVKQILAFSHQSNQDIKPIKLHSIVKDALRLLRSSIPSTIDIQQDLDSECGFVNADPTQIHQIVMNLATNAYHAMENTGGRLTVRLKQIRLESGQTLIQDLAPGEYARLIVADTGTGIEKDVMNHIFDPYFTTKEIGKGTGLGLSVVQGIANSFNGDIRIDSETGKGTEIQVYLPINEQQVEDLRTDQREPIQGGNETILLVDDEETIVRIEQQILERLGYRVTPFMDSVDALEAFKANPDSFDLVVTDMTMPNMTGDQLTNELISITPDIPIIICTGFSNRINQEKAEAAGIKGFLMKPVVRSEMARMIRKVLSEK